MNCSIERQERGDAVVRQASGHGRCGLRGSNGPVNNAVQLFQKEGGFFLGQVQGDDPKMGSFTNRRKGAGDRERGVAGSAVASDNRALSNVVLSRVALPTATQAT